MLLASAELVIILSLLTISRETRGKNWCKNDGVGRMREMIGAPLPDPGGADVDARIAEYMRDQRDAAALLAKHCRECGKCRLAREPIIGAPLRVATHRGEEVAG